MTSAIPYRIRLAIIVSHPIQYYAPWFAYLERHLQARVRVYYLWNFGVTDQYDPGFGRSLQWDIDLREGYDHQFVVNEACSPGTHHFNGLRNPSLIPELLAWKPTTLLLFGYRYWTHLQVITSRKLRKIPLIFRGDSHFLGGKRPFLHRLAKQVSLRAVYRRFSAFLPVGQANADYFLRHGYRRSGSSMLLIQLITIVSSRRKTRPVSQQNPGETN